MFLRNYRRCMFLVLLLMTPGSEPSAHASKDSQNLKTRKRKREISPERTSCSVLLSTSISPESERSLTTLPSFNKNPDGASSSVLFSNSASSESRRSLTTLPSLIKREREINGNVDVSGNAEVKIIVQKRPRILRGQFSADNRNLIGSGGQADIHRTSLNLYGSVAVKLMKQQCPKDALKEFLLKKFQPNPFIVQLYGFVYNKSDDAYPKGYIMESLDLSLDKVIKDSVLSKYTINQAFTIIKKICSGIFHMHSFGIMHRDIKPANILVSRDLKYVKICDWESGQLINDVSQYEPKVQISEGTRALTISGGVGTYGYMAPEVMVKEPGTGPLYTEKCDVFSLAITAWEILSKQQPYSGGPLKIVEQVLAKVRPDLKVLSLGEQINSIFRSAWSHDPNKRPSMMEINTKLLFEREDERKYLGMMNYSNGMYSFDTALNDYIDDYAAHLFGREEENVKTYVEATVVPVFGQVAVKTVTMNVYDARTYELMRELKVHPNIVRIFGFWSYGGPEYSGLIHKDEPENYSGTLPEYSLSDALEITRKICRGIQYLHQHGIVHRNIGRHNVLLSFDLKSVKLCGFRTFTREDNENEAPDEDGYDWMAPELIGFKLYEYNRNLLNEGNVSCDIEHYDEVASKTVELLCRFPRRKLDLKKCDVYSAAITFWELFHRRLPFEAQRKDNDEFEVELAEWVTRGKRLDFKGSPLDETMKDLLRSAWHPDPHQRPSILEILEKLDDPSKAKEPLKSSPMEPFLGEFMAGANEPMAFMQFGAEKLFIRTIIIQKAKEEGYFEQCLKCDSGKELVSLPWKPDNISRNNQRHWIEKNILVRISDGKLFYDMLTEDGLTLHFKLEKYFYARVR